jgi:hypothetical protein
MTARVVTGLRRWARGSVLDEAAVELLAGCLPGRFTSSGCAWVRPCRRACWYWLDAEALARGAAPLSADERRVLALIVSLLGDRPATPVGPAVGSDSGSVAA